MSKPHRSRRACTTRRGGEDAPDGLDDAHRAEELARVTPAAAVVERERDGVHGGPEAHAERAARGDDRKHEPARARDHEQVDERVDGHGRAREREVELGGAVRVARRAQRAPRRGRGGAQGLVALRGELDGLGLEEPDDGCLGCQKVSEQGARG